MPNKWWEIGNESTRERAEEVLAKFRKESPECKFGIRERREKRWYRSSGDTEGETRFIIMRLCEGQG